ncbi:MAG TPA: hypothetical protein VM870_07975 [Pyrinomonadaceae bacterium]|nr:hypothetical protein [Pyrinomonadaceae bacterium]
MTGIAFAGAVFTVAAMAGGLVAGLTVLAAGLAADLPGVFTAGAFAEAFD